MKCNQTTCNKKATHRYTWPDEKDEKFSCEGHARYASTVMDALGRNLEIIPLEEEEQSNV